MLPGREPDCELHSDGQFRRHGSIFAGWYAQDIVHSGKASLQK